MEETTRESKGDQEQREIQVVCVVLQRHDVEFLVAAALLLLVRYAETILVAPNTFHCDSTTF